MSIFPHTLPDSFGKESDKIHISNETMTLMDANGEFLVINELYGVRYGTPSSPIKKALEEKNFPVLDWPISHLEIMTNAFPNQLHIVYVSPPSWEVLEKRIEKDQRNKNTDRMEVARKELELFEAGGYEGLYNFQITSFDSGIPDIAKDIYLNYLQNIK